MRFVHLRCVLLLRPRAACLSVTPAGSGAAAAVACECFWCIGLLGQERATALETNLASPTPSQEHKTQMALAKGTNGFACCRWRRKLPVQHRQPWQRSRSRHNRPGACLEARLEACPWARPSLVCRWAWGLLQVATCLPDNLDRALVVDMSTLSIPTPATPHRSLFFLFFSCASSFASSFVTFCRAPLCCSCSLSLLIS